MRVQYSKPVAGLSAIQSQTFHELFGEYEGRLVRARYHQISARLHCLSIAHFGVWIEREGRPLETINEQTLEAFERHRSTCRCPGTSRNRTRQVRSCVRGFLRHLRERGVTPVEARPQPVRWVQGFLRWMRVDRGVVESTLTSYGSYVGDLVRVLGDAPRTYTARGLRDGGRTAEEIALGEISTGAQNDLQRATDIARAMVTEFGMSDELGAINYDGNKRARFLDIPMPMERGLYGEETAQKIDAEIKRILTNAHDTAREILNSHRDQLETVTRRLLCQGENARAGLRTGLPLTANTP